MQTYRCQSRPSAHDTSQKSRGALRACCWASTRASRLPTSVLSVLVRSGLQVDSHVQTLPDRWPPRRSSHSASALLRAGPRRRSARKENTNTRSGRREGLVWAVMWQAPSGNDPRPREALPSPAQLRSNPNLKLDFPSQAYLRLVAHSQMYRKPETPSQAHHRRAARSRTCHPRGRRRTAGPIAAC
jgi:hypothetical protein